MAARAAAHHVRALLHRLEERREARQAHRLERPSLDREGRERGVRSDGARSGRPGASIRNRTTSVVWRGLLDLTRIAARREHGDSCVAQGRESETADGLDHAIEFEASGCRSAWNRQLGCRRGWSRSAAPPV